MSAMLLNQNTSQLVVIDLQEKLGAAMPAKVIGRLVNNVSLLLRSAAVLDVPVTVTQQYTRGLGPTLAEVQPLLPSSTPVVEKTEFACTGVPEFMQRLQEQDRRQVLLCGMEAHVCVLQTAFALAAADYDVFMLEDAVCSRKLENYQNALERARSGGVHVVSSESAVFEWLGGAEHPQFKTISDYIK